jgi:hypothetical protein
MGLLIVSSAVLAYVIGNLGKDKRLLWGRLLLAAWAILPPIWFWIEWIFLCDGLSPEQREDRKHNQELSRNVWLAMIVLLVVYLRIPWPVGE